MPHVVMLGTGSALPGSERENTYLVVQGSESRILVDCGGAPAGRLRRAGIAIERIDKVILTHTHPDHIYGWPVFALNAWMAGRRAPMDVYGLPETLRAARTMLTAVGAGDWPDFFRVQYHRVRPHATWPILKTDEFEVHGTVTRHFVPTLAVRVESAETGNAIAYSSDTSPFPGITDLARDAVYLIHEATTLDMPSAGHSSAVQAGETARNANARRLVLVHLPPDVRPARWRAAAKSQFSGPVIVARDLQSFEF